MPIHEFECGRWGARFEKLGGAGTEFTRCRVCGADGTRRLHLGPQ